MSDWIRKICEENAEKARLRALKEEKERARAFSRKRFSQLIDPEKWDENDFEVRETKDGFESYNKHTNVIIYRYPSHDPNARQEAWSDIREEFGRN